MRRLALTFAITLIAASANAQSSKAQVSIFTRNVTNGFGLAYAYSFSPRWSAELKVAKESHWNDIAPPPVTEYIPVPERVKLTSYPIDLLGYYRFENESRWTPYVSGGVHYVDTPAVDRVELCASAPPCTRWAPIHDPFLRARYGSRVTTQVGAGTLFRITPQIGLRFDVDASLNANDVFYDRAVRPSFGLTWRF